MEDEAAGSRPAASGAGGASPSGLPVVLMFTFAESIGRMLTEIVHLEGYPLRTAKTADQAVTALERTFTGTHDGVPGAAAALVLMDNLQVHAEGQDFLERLRALPALRARLRTVSFAVRANNEGLRRRYVDMPFTVAAFLDALTLERSHAASHGYPTSRTSAYLIYDVRASGRMPSTLST